MQPSSSKAPILGSTPTRLHPLRVTTDSIEYTRLCLKHFVLGVVTLGLYSAWSSIEKRQYKARHTILDGHPFDYHANPWQLLKIRAFALVVLLAMLGMTELHIALLPPFLFVYFQSIHWLAHQASAHKIGGLSYRGVHFELAPSPRWFWQSRGGQEAKPHPQGTMIGSLFRRIRFGGVSFHHLPEPLASKKILFWPMVAYLCVSLGIFIYTVLIALEDEPTTLQLLDHIPELPRLLNYPIDAAQFICDHPVFSALCVSLWFACLGALAAVTNRISASKTALASLRFESRMRAWPSAWIHGSAALLSLISLGLALPWARLRIHRYYFENLRVQALAPLLSDFSSGIADITRE